MSDSLGVRKFKSLLITSSAEMAIAVIVLMSDSIITGHIAGEAGISGVNLVTPLYSCVVFISTLISTGISFSYGLAMGKFDKDRANKLFGLSVILSSSVGIILFAAMYLYSDYYFAFMSPSDEVLKFAHEYFKFFMYTVLLNPINTLISTTVYDDGDELICNIANVVQIFGNIILSVVLALYMGVAGISLATLITLTASTLILCCHFFRAANSLKAKIYFSLRDCITFAKFGFVDSGMYFMWAILLLAMNKFVISVFGDYYLPVLSMSVSLLEIGVVFDGIALAMKPLASVYYGEGNPIALRQVMRAAEKISLYDGIIFTVILIAGADYVPYIFGIDEPELMRLCAYAVRIISLTLVFSAVLYLYETYLMIPEKTFIVMLSAFLRNMILPLLFGITFGLVLGLNGVWVGFALAPVITFAACVWFMRKIYGRELFPLYIEDGDLTDYSIVMTPENIIAMRDEAEKFLIAHNISRRKINDVMLIIEETGMLILEHNEGKKIHAETTIKASEGIELIMRDEGEIFDITDADSNIRLCCGIRSMFRGAIRGLLEVFRNCSYRCSFRNSVSGYALGRCCTSNGDENRSVRGNVRETNRDFRAIPLS